MVVVELRDAFATPKEFVEFVRPLMTVWVSMIVEEDNLRESHLFQNPPNLEWIGGKLIVGGTLLGVFEAVVVE